PLPALFPYTTLFRSPDEVHDATGLLRRHADVSHAGDRLHHFSSSSCHRLAATTLLVVLLVSTVGARRHELAELVTHHGLGHEDRDVLASVVDGDRVTQHGRDDHRAT